MDTSIPTQVGAHRHLQQIIAGLREGVILIQPDQRICWANEAALAMHGVKAREELGDTVQAFRSRFTLTYRNKHSLSEGDYPIERVVAGEIFAAMRWMMGDQGWMAEGGACVGVAALQSGAAADADTPAKKKTRRGSRGGRTFSAPSYTPTAPRSSQPMQRTETPSPGMASPGIGGAAAAQPRRFGFGTGLMAGLFGAGLLGMMTGHGFFGGLAGLMSVFGLLFQVALIGGLI